MPIKDPIIRKEYARLSMAIRIARANNWETKHLLTKRQDLLQRSKKV